MIKIKGLKKSFGDLEVLKGIDLEVKQGEVVAIIGPSGTGKSTLLRCINYLETPNEGSISVNNVEVDAAKHNMKQVYELRKQSAMIFQSFNLFNNKKIIDNITLAPEVVQKKNKKEFLIMEVTGNSFFCYCIFPWLWRYSLGLMSWVRWKTWEK